MRLRARQTIPVSARSQVTRGQLQPALTTIEAATALADTTIPISGSISKCWGARRDSAWDSGTKPKPASAPSWPAPAERADVYREAQAINNLGMSRLIRNRFDDALPQFERVLSFNDLEQTRIYAPGA